MTKDKKGWGSSLIQMTGPAGPGADGQWQAPGGKTPGPTYHWSSRQHPPNGLAEGEYSHMWVVTPQARLFPGSGVGSPKLRFATGWDMPRSQCTHWPRHPLAWV